MSSLTRLKERDVKLSKNVSCQTGQADLEAFCTSQYKLPHLKPPSTSTLTPAKPSPTLAEKPASSEKASSDESNTEGEEEDETTLRLHARLSAAQGRLRNVRKKVHRRDRTLQEKIEEFQFSQ